ncbi:hypothetical protein Micbo1qcDRAFT_235263 [Microdochium bolleyi]|uniref:MARVEL domain-containing protein n=1 Tax=Microdochium bolleyi TaxID=196109 RepID=A0A136IXJ2_9PEZI|nr:hypothetical protein Micbo1qcDRAFT_235263 [Microdochium bolleyi]
MAGNHRLNSHFTQAKWSSRILWPCWVTQSILLLVLMGLFSYRLSATLSESHRDHKVQNAVPIVTLVWEAAHIGFALICFFVTLISIARFVAEALTPASMLWCNIVSLVLAVAILALDIFVHVNKADLRFSIIGLVFDSILLVSAVILCAYSIMTYRRISQYDDYHLPYNVQSYGYDNHETAYAPTQPYDPTDPAAPSGRARSLSVLSAGSRRLSIGARRESTSSVQMQPMPDTTRRASYDHKRDTQFDDYRARRTSGAGFNKEEVDHALGTEFGWSDERKRDSVVSAGSVNAAHHINRPRGNSNPSALQRHGSFEATVETPASTAVAAFAQKPVPSRAHSLVCVPEHPEEDIGTASIGRHSSYTTRASYGGVSRMGDDRERLLNPYARPVSPLN